MEASDLPELGKISRLSFEYALRALIEHGSMLEAIKLLRQYVGLDENGNLRMGLREAKDLCDGLKAEMSRSLANEWRPWALHRRKVALNVPSQTILKAMFN